ncbi:MAG: DUF2782 domain-containing protein [Burkholderiales bacterium]|nr:DUF2782 domain-containing protein [Burkholderiales bacterium]MCE7876280.1 DUF2782 domain-containing protein [Betaproteobacteria bacterium PRO3]
MHPLVRLAAALVLVLGVAAGAAYAQVSPPPPLPPATGDAAAPVPPPSFSSDPDLEQQVTITHKDRESTEEVRVGGVLQYVRVTPRGGPPYFLVPNRDGTGFLRRNSLDNSLSVPQWQLFSW